MNKSRRKTGASHQRERGLGERSRSRSGLKPIQTRRGVTIIERIMEERAISDFEMRTGSLLTEEVSLYNRPNRGRQGSFSGRELIRGNSFGSGGETKKKEREKKDGRKVFKRWARNVDAPTAHIKLGAGEKLEKNEKLGESILAVKRRNYLGEKAPRKRDRS